MIREEMRSPIKMTIKNAISINRFCERMGTQFMMKLGHDNMIRLNSLLSTASCGLRKGEKICLYVDKDDPMAETKLKELMRQFESLA